MWLTVPSVSAGMLRRGDPRRLLLVAAGGDTLRLCGESERRVMPLAPVVPVLATAAWLLFRLLACCCCC